MWIKDPKTKEQSVTVTLLIITFVVALTKLLLAGSSMGSFTFGAFSGGDFSQIVGTVGALYGVRKFTDKEKKD